MSYGLRVELNVDKILPMNKKITSFEDLIIWQKAQNLAVDIYRLVDSNKFIVRDHSLKDQLKRAAMSVSDNIAEGFEYNNAPDFHRYLRISKGSCGEIRNKILFIERLSYIDQDTSKILLADCTLLSAQIGQLIKKVKQKMATAKTTRNT